MPRHRKTRTPTQPHLQTQQHHLSPPPPVHLPPPAHHLLPTAVSLPLAQFPTAPSTSAPLLNQYPHPNSQQQPQSAPHHPSPPSSSSSASPPPSTSPPQISITSPEIGVLNKNRRPSGQRLSKPKKAPQQHENQVDISERILATSKASCLRKKHHKSSQGVNVGHLHLTNLALYFQAHYLKVAPEDAQLSLPLVSITLVRTSSYRHILPYALHVRCRGAPDYLFAFACSRDQLTFRHHLELAIHDANESHNILNNINNSEEEDHDGTSIDDHGNIDAHAGNIINDNSNNKKKSNANISNPSNPNTRRFFRVLTRSSRNNTRPNSSDTNNSSNSTDDRENLPNSLTATRSLVPRHFARRDSYVDDHNADNQSAGNNLNGAAKSSIPRSFSNPGDSTSSLALVEDPDMLNTLQGNSDIYNRSTKVDVVSSSSSGCRMNSDQDGVTIVYPWSKKIAKAENIQSKYGQKTQQRHDKSAPALPKQTILQHGTEAESSMVTEEVTIGTTRNNISTMSMEHKSRTFKNHLSHRRSMDSVIVLIFVIIFMFIFLSIVMFVNQFRVRLVVLEENITKIFLKK